MEKYGIPKFKHLSLEALESCVTHDNQQQLYSPGKSEGKDLHQNPLSVSGALEGGGVSSDCNQELQQQQLK
jgi:hypothetical protein